MLRWYEVKEQDYLDMTIKMYRNPFMAKDTFVSPLKGLELDHYSFLNFGSELFTYRILDTNFERYFEERGDVSRIDKILIPKTEDASQRLF